MRFLVDAMLPPSARGLLADRRHAAVTPIDLGARRLSDDTLIETAGTDTWVAVTDNAVDVMPTTSCAVLLVREDWWPSEALAPRLAESLDRWAHARPHRGRRAHWLDSAYR